MTVVRKAEPMVDGSLVNYILDVTQYPKLRIRLIGASPSYPGSINYPIFI
jgi:hypothetical protein